MVKKKKDSFDGVGFISLLIFGVILLALDGYLGYHYAGEPKPVMQVHIETSMARGLGINTNAPVRCDLYIGNGSDPEYPEYTLTLNGCITDKG